MGRAPVAEVIVRSLERRGIQYVFGLPGTALIPLLAALEGSRVKFITTRHEQVAALMAVGYARASGRTGICLGSRGPAAANMTMGIHDAHQGSIPVVAILGQVSRRHLGKVALQEIDLEDFFRPITKWAVQVCDQERVAELLNRALTIAHYGRPGPVLVSIPGDLWGGDTLDLLPPPSPPPVPQASEETLLQVTAALHAARQPLIMAGGGIIAGGASTALSRLSNALGIPVVSSYGRGDLLPNSDPTFLGAMGLGAAEAAEAYAREADVVLAIGTKLAELSTMGYTIPSASARVIHIDIDPAALGVVRIPDPGVVADARSSLETMFRLVPQVVRGDESRLAERQRRTAAYRRQVEETWQLPVHEFRESPIHPAQVVQELQAVLPPDRYTITCDAGSYSRWVMRYLRLEIPGSWMIPTSGGMGFGLPAAMGVRLARPDHLVINIAGDGSFLMTCQDLETAVRERIPVVNVVFNNNCYGTIKDKQLAMYPDCSISANDLGNPDFGALARSFGAYGQRVEVASRIGPALREAIAFAREQELPAVVEVVVDPVLLAPTKPTIA